MNAKERVMAVLNHQNPDRMPCFGANSTVTYAQMDKVNAFWPEGHEKGETMAKQAMAAHTVIGFDGVRVPFSQTFEAEALGCKIKPSRNLKGEEGIPGIQPDPPYKIDDTPVFPDDFLSRGKIPELIKAVRILKEQLGDEVFVVGGIVGPFSISAALLDTVPLLRATLKTPDKLHSFLDISEKAGTALAKALVDAGADAISCEDMMISPELTAPNTYEDLELEYQTKQFDSLSVPKILHICGNVDLIMELMGKTGADVLSLEPKANLKHAREKCGADIVLMGGVDTANTLFEGEPDKVVGVCEQSISDGIQILAPGCAVAPGTPTENLLAMVEVAKSH